ncbi:thiamine phosphate synthase [Paenibacillus silvae]|uniref:thiamine phosphate synthase n=1 Tax=Paenibacillus silvae TaxID=1325358 RepID=UPI0025A156FA|nr:thiamine phosphate synthase [Paenibacillus silvae]
MNKTELAAERNEKNKRLFANSPMQMDTCSPTCCQDDSSFELHVLSTNKGERNNVLNVVKQIWPWVDYIHIREKQFSLQQHFFWARHMTESGVPSSRIVINGANPFVPSEYCRGAHWSQERLKKAAVSMNAVNKGERMRLGVSVHSIHEARVAADYGADYLFFGHVYTSRSKPDLTPRGLEALAEVCSGVDIPVIAIGGIQASNIQAVRLAGARGAAVISSIFQHENPAHAIRLIKQAAERVI